MDYFQYFSFSPLLLPLCSFKCHYLRLVFSGRDGSGKKVAFISLFHDAVPDPTPSCMNVLHQVNCFAFLLLPPVPLNMLLFFYAEESNLVLVWGRELEKQSSSTSLLTNNLRRTIMGRKYVNGVPCDVVPGIHVQELIKWLLKRGGSMYVSMLGSCATSAVCQTKMKASILAQPAPVSRMHNQPVGGANTRQQWEKHLEETTSGNATRLNYEQQCAAFQRILFDVPIVHHYFLMLWVATFNWAREMWILLMWVFVTRLEVSWCGVEDLGFFKFLRALSCFRITYVLAKGSVLIEISNPGRHVIK